MRILVPVAALWLATLAGPALAAPQHDQSTPTPTATSMPTATPTPVPPPGAKALIAASTRAVDKENTFHLNLAETIDFAGLAEGAVKLVGDVNLKQKSERFHTSGRLFLLGKPDTLNEDDIAIGKRHWTKSPKTHGRWKKGGNSSTPSQFNLHSLTPSGTMQQMTVTDGGALAGVPVWHVHGTVVVKLDTTHSTNGTFDYFIGKRNTLLYRFLEHVNARKQGIFLDLAANFSNFGEAVQITAPRVAAPLPRFDFVTPAR